MESEFVTMEIVIISLSFVKIQRSFFEAMASDDRNLQNRPNIVDIRQGIDEMARPTLTPEQCSPLGQFILEWTEQSSVTREAFARKCGLKSPVLRGAMLLGSNPTRMTLAKIAHGLELSPAALEPALQLHAVGATARESVTIARKTLEGWKHLEGEPPVSGLPTSNPLAEEAEEAMELYALLAEQAKRLPSDSRPRPEQIAVMAAMLARKKKAA